MVYLPSEQQFKWHIIWFYFPIREESVPGTKPVAPVTQPVVPTGHRVPDPTVEMLCSAPVWFWPEPQLELEKEKNRGAIAINLGSPNSPAGTILAHEQTGSILIAHIYNLGPNTFIFS